MPACISEFLRSRLVSFADAQTGWVAYSGGMDSAVLLHALVRIRGRLGFALRALHVDHGLHPDSPAWSEHCSRTCEQLEVPLVTRSVEVAVGRGESLEAVARRARYQAMADLLGHGDLLLTAHHRNDQAETLLLALMRGSGLAGLAAMPLVMPLGAGRMVRPLLDQDRAVLLEYAVRLDLDWLEDSGNRDLRFDRNFLRHQVVPLLAQRWPSWSKSIARSAAHCAEAQGIIDLLAKDALTKAAGRRPGTLSIDRLLRLEPSLRKAVLRRWFGDRGLAPPDLRHLGRIVSEVMTARVDANPLVAWPGCEVRRYRDDLFAMTPLPPVPAPDPIPWRKGVLSLPGELGRLEVLGTGGQSLDPQDLFFDGLDVRFAVEGLSCRRAAGGRRRSLKKLFQEAAVPPWVRPYVPLIFVRDGLVAVGDAWVCHTDAAAGVRAFRISWKSDLRRRFPLDLLGA